VSPSFGAKLLYLRQKTIFIGAICQRSRHTIGVINWYRANKSCPFQAIEGFYQNIHLLPERPAICLPLRPSGVQRHWFESNRAYRILVVRNSLVLIIWEFFRLLF